MIHQSALEQAHFNSQELASAFQRAVSGSYTAKHEALTTIFEHIAIVMRDAEIPTERRLELGLKVLDMIGKHSPASNPNEGTDARGMPSGRVSAIVAEISGMAGKVLKPVVQAAEVVA